MIHDINRAGPWRVDALILIADVHTHVTVHLPVESDEEPVLIESRSWAVPRGIERHKDFVI